MMQWLLRATCRAELPSPEPLPETVALRYAGWLPAIAGILSGMGKPAAAVTLGHTINPFEVQAREAERTTG